MTTDIDSTLPITPAKKTRKAKAARKPSAPRTIDPQIAALRAQHQDNVAALRKSRASAKTLEQLIKKVGTLTNQDRDRLVELLEGTSAPE